MLYLARGIEDNHYWVVAELDGGLVETPWRIEQEPDGWRISHADDYDETRRVFALGPHSSPEAAVLALQVSDDLGPSTGVV